MAEVRLDRIEKVYSGNVQAVKDVSFTVNDKEFVVLVGPSGCGKSTLFQNYALYPHMTVFENMAFGLKLRKMPRADIIKEVNRAADILDLSPLLNRKPKALSGGQRQRVAVGRALVRHPKVFLFDEPLSNLDAKLRIQMRSEISRLHQRLEATIVYVTHDQVEAMTMGDRIVVLNHGEIQQMDTPLKLYHSPKNQFTAGFIGSPPMNFLKGVIDREKRCFQGMEVTIPLNKRLTDNDANEVYLGIRPEDISLESESVNNDLIKLSAKVDVVEPMGHEIHLYIKSGDADWVARIPSANSLFPGEITDVYLDSGKLYLFSADTGLRITS